MGHKLSRITSLAEHANRLPKIQVQGIGPGVAFFLRRKGGKTRSYAGLYRPPASKTAATQISPALASINFAQLNTHHVPTRRTALMPGSTSSVRPGDAAIVRGAIVPVPLIIPSPAAGCARHHSQLRARLWLTGCKPRGHGGEAASR